MMMSVGDDDDDDDGDNIYIFRVRMHPRVKASEWESFIYLDTVSGFVANDIVWNISPIRFQSDTDPTYI